jgi:hypothetical protein
MLARSARDRAGRRSSAGACAGSVGAPFKGCIAPTYQGTRRAPRMGALRPCVLPVRPSHGLARGLGL